jgi:hypothetical protein
MCRYGYRIRGTASASTGKGLISRRMHKALGTFIVLSALFFPYRLKGQVQINGAVYDSTRLVPVPAVKVRSTRGLLTFTDSLGRYLINVAPDDSIAFTYMDKSTQYFPVRKITYPQQFDISLRVRVYDRYQTLNEVVVIGKTYKQDSVENRERYAKTFGASRGGATISSYNASLGEAPGLDPNELINMFRFRRNKNLKSLQKRLLDEEQEKYVNYRFNKRLVRTLTGFEGEMLEAFMKEYRPTYDFTAITNEYEFDQYVIDAAHEFRGRMKPRAEKKE